MVTETASPDARRAQLGGVPVRLAQPGEAVGFDAVQTPRPVLSLRHETRLLQDSEVLGHGRTADREVGGNLADRARPVSELLEDRPPCRVSERLQCLFVSHDLR